MGEFDYIEKYFLPLTKGNMAALGLKDDAALIELLSGNPAIVSKDILVAGTHFFDTDPLDMIAQKALRVNLSDCIAKAATPIGYLLGCVWKKDTLETDIALFAEGLNREARFFTQGLLGGDTTRTSQLPGRGIAMVSVTILGETDRMVRRDGACPEDIIFVTGFIGDAWLGLQSLFATMPGETVKAANMALDQHAIEHVTRRYHVPDIAFACIEPVKKFARASLDISDGLLADAHHIAAASNVGMKLYADRLPLSAAAQKWCTTQADYAKAIGQLATGGDDYQVLCTVSPENAAGFRYEAEQAGVAVTQIGQCANDISEVVLLDKNGVEIPLMKTGFQHF